MYILVDKENNFVKIYTSLNITFSTMVDITGLISFSNFIFVLSIILIVSALIWLFGIYFVTIALIMPVQMIELTLYGVLGFLIYSIPNFFSQDVTHVWGLLFGLGLSATTILTGIRIKGGKYQVLNFINMTIHGVIGIYLQSTLISAVSVMFFMALIGFEFGFTSNSLSFGYSDSSVIGSATISSGVTTAVGVLLRINTQNPDLQSVFFQCARLFVPGLLWFGSFVFFLSLLIVSSKYYANSRAYVNNNIVTIILSCSAVLIGNLYNIPQLTGFSGTFFCIFLLEKYCELIPNRTEAWAWSVLALGTIMYTLNVHYRAEFERYGLHEYFHIVPPLTSSSA